ncbi:MAG TPA: hypothetical protein VLJ80_13045 [Solirubrobacteraceae bacterium]|nr:hypothetical protein [Solirubrobacteraceae bacterium]
MLASNSHAQLYDRPSDGAQAGVYGCLRRGGRAVYLGEDRSYEGSGCLRKDEGHCARATQLVLAGTTVAYFTTPVEPGYAQEHAIVVRSIATGRALHSVAIRVRTVHQTMLEESTVLKIVAKPDGAVAWVQEDSFARHGGAVPPPPAYSVFAVDRKGFHTLTPELPASPRAMTLTGTTLSWSNEATRESALLD